MMHALSLFRRVAVGALLCLGAAAQTLGVGDPAPKIRVAGFLKGEPLTAFERDTTYVVEFWATWCVPCRKSIPHLTEVQQRYADRQVRVLGISVWENRAADVAPFVEKQGEQMGYTVAADEVLPGAEAYQGAMARTWHRAAGEVSLPTVFIIDGAGKIAWIGDSYALDKPLEQIVAGTWDLAAAKVAHELRATLNKLGDKLRRLLHAGKWSDALALADKMRELAPESEQRTAAWRFQCLLYLGRDEEAYAYAKRVVDGLLKQDALALNLVAWFIVDPEATRTGARDLDFALRVARRAVELTEEKDGAYLDTLALVRFTRGEVDQAIALQERAVALSVGMKWHDETKARLEQFRHARSPGPPPELGKR